MKELLCERKEGGGDMRDETGKIIPALERKCCWGCQKEITGTALLGSKLESLCLDWLQVQIFGIIWSWSADCFIGDH